MLTKKEYWDANYNHIETIDDVSRKMSYENNCIRYILDKQIKKNKPESILEIGCGNSIFLPYISKKYSISVAGIDYSKNGCNLLSRRFEAKNVNVKIFCEDIFNCNVEKIGKYDFIYSLGVVEHFSDIDRVLKKMLEFLNPGGIILTEIPNLPSIHSWMSKIWHPEILSKHNIKTKSELPMTYKNLNLQNIHFGYLGIFSFNMITWRINTKFPKIGFILLPFIFILSKITDFFLCIIRNYEKGNKFFAPFFYIVGNKK